MRTENSGERKRVVILGATGSIGESALKVARDIPERMEIVGLAAKGNAEKLAVAANETHAQSVCLVDETKIDILTRKLDYKPQIFTGEEGLREIACLTNAEMVLVAIVGTGGLRPTLAAIEAGKDLAIASKEILVMAGEIVMREAHDSDGIRRTISRNAAKRFRFDHTRTGVEASDLEYGSEDHDRFRDAVQQGFGNDRGALAFWRRDEARRSGDTPAEHCSFDGRVRRRIHARAIELFEHVFPNSIRRDLAGSRPEHFAATRFLKIVQVGIFSAALRRFSCTEPRAPSR